jgi:hypothetical protein
MVEGEDAGGSEEMTIQPNHTIIIKSRAYRVMEVKGDMLRIKSGWFRVDEVEGWSPF